MNHQQPLRPEELDRSPEGMAEAFCILQGHVNEEVYGFRIPSDCFCPAGQEMRNRDGFSRFDSDPEVYAFIVEAVQEKLAQRREYRVTNTAFVKAFSSEGAEIEAEHVFERGGGRIDVTRWEGVS